MKLNELKSICENLIETFNEAGKVSIDLYKKGLQIKIKEDKSPVSNGDLKVNELITNKIKDLTPNIPIVSEETVDLGKKNEAKIFWLIDPIDGTKAFISGIPVFTFLLSLKYKNDFLFGLVDQPILNERFWNYENKAYLNNKEIKVKNKVNT